MIFKRYSVGLIGGIWALSMLYILMFNTLVWVGLDVQKLPFETLYNYQIEKAEHSTAKTVFIGDSILGNAINAEYWCQISVTKPENFTLKGSFGYRGSFDMLQRVYKSNPGIKTVYIMQTMDNMSCPIVSEYKPVKYYFKTETFPGIDLSVFNYSVLKLFFRALWQWDWSINSDAQNLKDNYVAQEQPLNPDLNYYGMHPNQNINTKTEYLHRISKFCWDHALTCIYVHVPVVEYKCLNSNEYLNAANEMIRETELKLAREVFQFFKE